MRFRNMTAYSLLTAALIAVGCEKTASTAPVTASAAATSDKHDDHTEGPRGGAVIELGKYHGEFVVDHGKKTATVHILDGDVKKDVPIATDKLLLSIKSPQFQVDLKADPQAGDPKGKCSRFTATHENFAKEQEFEGTVSLELEGKPYLGDFKEEAHKDHNAKMTKKDESKPTGAAAKTKPDEIKDPSADIKK